MKSKNIYENIQGLIKENPELQAYYDMVAKILGCAPEEIESVDAEVETIYEHYLHPIEAVNRITLPDGKVFISHKIEGKWELLCKPDK